MIAVILNILKVTGIILLGFIGVLLLLLVLVLFVPIRYEAKGYYHDTYSLTWKASWCLRFLTLCISATEAKPLKVVCRICGIQIKRKQKKKQLKKRKKKAETKIHPVSSQDECRQDGSIEQKKDKSVQEKESRIEIKKAEVPKQETDMKNSQKTLSFFDKIRISIQTALYHLFHWKELGKQFFTSCKKRKEKIRFYIHSIQGEAFAVAFERSKVQILRILSNLKPQKCYCTVWFGRENEPDLVGEVLGIWGMTYMLHKGNVQIVPSFDKDVLEGEFYVKGRISLYLYVWMVYIVLFDKNIKYLKACVTQEE